MRRVRTRFAPSPTGEFHIGGLRTALVNFLYAKQNHGDFVLRIEDTDQTRNQQEQVQKILDYLESLLLIPDESFVCPGLYGPYLQTQKIEIYKKRIQELFEKDKVYRCFCTEEELEKEREENPYLYSGKCKHLSKEEIDEKLANGVPYCYRLKLDQSKEYVWEDYVRGKMTVPASSMGEIILMRSNGLPTYNFAVVVDDYEMKISDIFRGEEHLSNTPYQIALYEAFGWEEFIPNFGHLSLIMSAETGKKISKRDVNAQKYLVSYFLEKGYHPEALLNYLLLLGWTCGEREFFNLKESISNFSISGLSGSPSICDFKKLEWMSFSYLSKMDVFQYLNFVLPFFKGNIEGFQLSEEMKKEFAIRFRSRVKYAYSLVEISEEFYSKKYLNEEFFEKLKGYENIEEFIEKTLSFFTSNQVESWTEAEARLLLKKLFNELGTPKPDICHKLRFLLTGDPEGLPMYSTILLLGQDNICSRLRDVSEKLK
ncbi:glutamate--tRNA ligase [Mycoplasma suis]|uniref:glutamate--tRNA ligase n=1 Tax=Mycoplasma suis TaxID=57372 RepID=UPI0005C63907